MLFNEIYSVYYNAVAEIIKFAVKGELTDAAMYDIVQNKAFEESNLTIPQALKSGKWQLITPDLKTPIKHEPKMPLTLLQKRWLKSVLLDKRTALFDINIKGLEDVEPLFTPDDIYYYDQYSDGDDYDDPGYKERFKIILEAVKTNQPLRIEFTDRRGRTQASNVYPEKLEYSQKDDKFRLVTSGCRYLTVAKLQNIVKVKPYFGENIGRPSKYVPPLMKTVTFTLYNQRNTLERALLHFAHFEKTVEKTQDGNFTVNIKYSSDDESELLIRILSFGPFIKVTAPESFVKQIQMKLALQRAVSSGHMQ